MPPDLNDMATKKEKNEKFIDHIMNVVQWTTKLVLHQLNY
jgi:hypothetical protein